MVSAYSLVKTAPPTIIFTQGAFSLNMRIVASMLGTVVVINALKPLSLIHIYQPPALKYGNSSAMHLRIAELLRNMRLSQQNFY